MAGFPSATAFFTTSITEAEIHFGLELRPAGKRRNALKDAIALVFEADLSGRVLPFDSSAAREYGILAANRRRIGKPMSQADAQIAAIVRSRGAALATRNVTDFAGCAFEVIDPWQ
ncbi:MAG TPA: type II toxin-antitoxin system VapC family toxin [Rhizomicrobium sp.]